MNIMNSDSNRVFSTTMARETFTNNLASISPAVSNPLSMNIMQSEFSTSGYQESGTLQWISPNPELVNLSSSNFIPSDHTAQVKRKLELDAHALLQRSANSSSQNDVEQLVNLQPMNFNKPVTLKPVVKQGGKQDRNPQVSNTPNRKRPRTISSSSTISHRSPGEKSRYDTSLGLLTKRFIQLMHSSDDGVLDLNQAAGMLSVQKRRIYDITNVLEGIKLIEKRSKNNVQWTASASRGSESDQDTDVTRFRQGIKKLKLQENELDDLIRQRQVELEQLSESNSKHSYVTYHDIRSIQSFKDQIVICIKAPQDTKLEVPDPGEKIQMLLKSTKGEIDVFLCPDPEDLASPSKSCVSPASGDGCVSDSTLENSPKLDLMERLSPPGTEHQYDSLLADDSTTIPTSLKSSLLQGKNPYGEREAEADSAFIDEDSGSFIALSPAINPDDYLFSLDDSEGIAELFDINATELPNSSNAFSQSNL